MSRPSFKDWFNIKKIGDFIFRAKKSRKYTIENQYNVVMNSPKFVKSLFNLMLVKVVGIAKIIQVFVAPMLQGFTATLPPTLVLVVDKLPMVIKFFV